MTRDELAGALERAEIERAIEESRALPPVCRDPDCAECRADLTLEAVCECGDSQRSHYGDDHTGQCGICRSGRAPWDNCRRFRFSHWETKWMYRS